MEQAPPWTAQWRSSGLTDVLCNIAGIRTRYHN